jgi:hypothetical protein
MSPSRPRALAAGVAVAAAVGGAWWWIATRSMTGSAPDRERPPPAASSAGELPQSARSASPSPTERASAGPLATGSSGGRCARPPPVIAPALARCDKPGRVLWGLRLGQAEGDVAGSVALTPGGQALIVGDFGARAMNDGDTAFLATVDAASGRLVSQTELASGTNVRMTDVAVSSDGRVAVAGAYDGSLRLGEPRDRDAGDPTAFVMVFDSAGEVAFSWAGHRDGGARAEVLAFDGCGGLLVGGTFRRTLIPGRVESPPSDRKDIFLLKLDAAGELLWTRRLGGEGDQEIAAAAITREGRIDVVGHTYSGVVVDGSSAHRLHDGSVEFIAELSDTGEVQWVKRASKRERLLFSAAVELPEGGSIAVGALSPDDGTTELVLQQFDARGEAGWQRVYGHRDWGSRLPSAAAVSLSGTLAVAGTLSGSIRLGDQVLRSRGRDKLLPSRQIPPTDIFTGTFDRDGKARGAWVLGDDSWQEARDIKWAGPNWGIVVGSFEGTIPLDDGQALASEGRRDAFALALCLE